MNRADRRRPSKAVEIRKIMEDLSTVHKIKEAIAGDWPFKQGDKVKLDMKKIKAEPDYDRKLPLYRQFCEKNAEQVFTVEYIDGMNPSVVCLAEDESTPKWFFWTGHLKAATV